MNLITRASTRDIGIHSIRFSTDDRFIVGENNDNIKQAFKEASRSSMLWIWDIKRNCLSASFTFATPIVMFSWSPQDDKLAVVTSNQTLYF